MKVEQQQHAYDRRTKRSSISSDLASSGHQMETLCSFSVHAALLASRSGVVSALSKKKLACV